MPLAVCVVNLCDDGSKPPATVVTPEHRQRVEDMAFCVELLPNRPWCASVTMCSGVGKPLRTAAAGSLERRPPVVFCGGRVADPPNDSVDADAGQPI
jgi:hypothetical protein